MSRLLKPEERRVIVDALRAAAARTRLAKRDAQSLSALPPYTRKTHIDHLDRLEGTQDRLAAEIHELEVRLEKLES